MAKVMLHWKPARMHGLSGGPGDPIVQLMPGMNEVDAEVWEKVRKHKLTQHYLEAGDLVVGSKTEAEPAGEDDGEKKAAPPKKKDDGEKKAESKGK